jgi:hypothetical protein
MEIPMAPKSPSVRTTRRRLHALASGGLVDIAGGADAGTLDEHLPALARLIEKRAFAADDDPQIIRVTRDGISEEGIDVGLRYIDDIDDSVVTALTGFAASPDWLAIGVSTGGNAYPLGEERDERRRVRVVHLVTRAGNAASVMRLAGEEPRLVVGTADDETMIGRVDDVCRRALGLPTAPAESTLEFWALLWLEQLLQTDEAPTKWVAVAAKHPAVEMLVDAEPTFTTAASQNLVRLGRRLSKIVDWSSLRTCCADGHDSFHGVPPVVARWLDDGAFSRWVMGSYPSLEQLTRAVCELVSPAFGRRLRSVLREWGLDPPPIR